LTNSEGRRYAGPIVLGFDLPVALPGLEGQTVVVRVPGLFSAPRLVVEGRPVSRRAGKDTYVLQTPEGATKTVVLERGLLDPVRRLRCDGVTVPLARPFGWGERLWLALPVVAFYLVGGIPGAFLGAGAAYVNARVFRRPEPLRRRYTLAGVVVLVTAGVAELLRVVVTAALAMTVMLALFGRWSCSELTFDATRPTNRSWTTPVEVTAADERAHPALAWVAGEVTGGKARGGRSGRRLVDDFAAFVKERHVDPGAVRTPVFILHGRPVFITPIGHCL
jgi:hypothetical protein